MLEEFAEHGIAAGLNLIEGSSEGSLKGSEGREVRFATAAAPRWRETVSTERGPGFKEVVEQLLRLTYFANDEIKVITLTLDSRDRRAFYHLVRRLGIYARPMIRCTVDFAPSNSMRYLKVTDKHYLGERNQTRKRRRTQIGRKKRGTVHEADLHLDRVGRRQLQPVADPKYRVRENERGAARRWISNLLLAPIPTKFGPRQPRVDRSEETTEFAAMLRASYEVYMEGRVVAKRLRDLFLKSPGALRGWRRPRRPWSTSRRRQGPWKPCSTVSSSAPHQRLCYPRLRRAPGVSHEEQRQRRRKRRRCWRRLE